MSSLRGSISYLWDVTKPLGQGATSMVYKGRNKSTGEEVAVKVFSQAAHMRPHDVQMRELVVMKKLSHRNIVPLLAIEDEQNTRNKVIVMQLTEHGSLYNMLEEPKHAYGLPEEEFLIVFDHVTLGMKYMRDSDIVHRDIKPGNILRYIGEDGKSVYKLTDFGAAKQLQDEEEPFMSLYGTEEYLHPDMYERAVLRATDRKQFTSKVDLWSLGVTFFHVATGQLPFKPFGGRKNRVTMFEITRNKESGVITGIQHIEGGPIEWSKELPKSCRLSTGLKLLITPIFAKLLESEPRKAWDFDSFFKQVETIVKKGVIHVFCPHTWNSLAVYINKEQNLTHLQDLIAQQTDIQSNVQLLIFDGQQLHDHVQPMLPISSYPEGITGKNPIFCYNKACDEGLTFPVVNIKDFPKYGSNLTSEDYTIAKQCTAIACYIHKEVEWHCHKQELMRRSVHMYIHELYHECGHLLDYNKFLMRNCDTSIKWKDNFLRTFKRELKLLHLLIDKTDTRLNSIMRDLGEMHDSCNSEIDKLTKQITELSYDVESHLNVMQNDHLNKKLLKKLWNDSIGCIGVDRCVPKVEVVLDQIMKTKAQFSEDRRRSSLSFNEEQIHKYEKNRLSENCIKIRSLFTDHCLAGAKDQFQRFHSWYSAARDVRIQSDIIEQNLLKLADMMEDFVTKLNRWCLKYNDDVERYMRKIEDVQRDVMREKPDSLIGRHSLTESMMGGAQSREENKKNRHLMIRKVLEGLSENQHTVSEMKEDLVAQSEQLRSYFARFQMDSLTSDPQSSKAHF